MPVSMIMSRTLLRRMRKNNEHSAAMNAKMSGFNQEAFSNIQTIKAFNLIRLYTERLMDILDMPSEDFSEEEKVHSFLAQNRSRGISYACSGLTYSYHTGTEVFAHAGLEAHPHEIVALVGPSGEGKTTMLRLLLALLNPQEGESFFTGEATGEKMRNTPAARELFSYVPQGITMFSGTIAENMRFVKPDATDEEIEQVLRQACAWGFVEKLQDGIYSAIGERGTGFSEGQSQRLSIARALLRKSPILLMDEATSALDVATEEEIRQLMDNFLLFFLRWQIIDRSAHDVCSLRLLCAFQRKGRDQTAQLCSKAEVGFCEGFGPTGRDQPQQDCQHRSLAGENGSPVVRSLFQEDDTAEGKALFRVDAGRAAPWQTIHDRYAVGNTEKIQVAVQQRGIKFLLPEGGVRGFPRAGAAGEEPRLSAVEQ